MMTTPEGGRGIQMTMPEIPGKTADISSRGTVAHSAPCIVPVVAVVVVKMRYYYFHLNQLELFS